VLAEQRIYHVSHTSIPFCCGYFEDGGLMGYLPELASNFHLPYFSLLSRIIGESHHCLAQPYFFKSIKEKELKFIT
jgi:hypothetical protein